MCFVLLLAGNEQCGNSNNYGILFQGRQIALSSILNGIAQLLHTRSVANCKPCTVVASSIVVYWAIPFNNG